jgi:excisionase family DNA binding protein
MAEKKYYSIDEAAAVLGVTPAEINLRRERNELHGYRDGANWKFKAEDVDALARRLRSQAISAAAEEDDTGEVLLSEVALGGSDAGISGTVIGGKGKKATDSDLRLVDSDVKLSGSDVKLSGSDAKRGGSDVKREVATAKPGGSALDLAPEGPKKTPSPGSTAAGAPDLDVTINEELLLDEEMPLEEEKKPAAPAAKKPGDSAVEVSGRKLDDDDLVIGGSGSGSDITIGGDSGISLVDPTDSGLSLEEPLELEREPEDDSLELGEDDMLTFSEEADADAPTAMKTDEGFQLTPMEESGEEESESGSQVIALEGTPISDAAPTMIAGGPSPLGAAAMLDEDFAGAAAPVGLGVAVPAAGSPLGAAQAVYGEAGPTAVPSMVLPEAPYSGLQITALSACVVLLVLCGWMSYDLLRNMWGWNGAYTVNSKLMDMIVGLFG